MEQLPLITATDSEAPRRHRGLILACWSVSMVLWLIALVIYPTVTSDLRTPSTRVMLGAAIVLCLANAALLYTRPLPIPVFLLTGLGGIGASAASMTVATTHRCCDVVWRTMRGFPYPFRENIRRSWDPTRLTTKFEPVGTVLNVIVWAYLLLLLAVVIRPGVVWLWRRGGRPLVSTLRRHSGRGAVAPGQ
ncbi:MAG: hypothetical protein JWN03_6726 [Nocardia sp.]|nr:hypothetical protein [Nocardia sp.]